MWVLNPVVSVHTSCSSCLVYSPVNTGLIVWIKPLKATALSLSLFKQNLTVAPCGSAHQDHQLKKKKQSQIVMELEAHCLLHLQIMPTQIQQLWWKMEKSLPKQDFCQLLSKTRRNIQSWLNKGKKALKIGILFAFVTFEVRQMETNLSSCRAKLEGCKYFPNFDEQIKHLKYSNS